MSFEQISYLALAFVLVALAISGWLGARPPDLTEQVQAPFNSIYFRQPPSWALVCAGLGLGCLFVAIGTGYVGFTVAIGWVLGFVLGVTRSMPRVKTMQDGTAATPAADLALPPWWQRESSGGWLGAALIAASSVVTRTATDQQLATLASVTLAFYGYVELARWLASTLVMWTTRPK